ncbi:DUF1244 domain-containing protein [Methyloligella sp. 2.7D]|uniref:DUF1244 domain-containing protein n=1 Tax=unclassified Methyloligella TaxID=2625955 RepID=UPI00157BBD41|nr:DUF1244 domain-containing protein [Methyloligella sp. GL2]QKP76781.1 DUF1244 domain-containing protein [Methyloligella sp. GL2]
MEQRTVHPLQSEAENEAYRLIEGDPELGLIILCDHAENRIPPEYDQLGLKPEHLRRHIAYDPGALPVAEKLAAKLGVPAVVTRFSRLLIDPNRGPSDPTQIMQISDGLVIPGNVGLSEAEKENRRKRFYEPYHAAIDTLIDEGIAHGRVPVLLSMHSFTPAWKSVPRPWHAGILWDKDWRLPKPLLAGLAADPELIVDENVPYNGELEGDTLNRHGSRRGIAHALVELRQDLLFTEEEHEDWAERLARIVRGILDDAAMAAELHKIHHFGRKGHELEGHELGARCAPPASGGAEISDETLRIELEAAVFRRLRDHLRKRTDVQNIDLMELAGFCRNCLSNWYREAAEAHGLLLSKEEAREIVYGMAYDEWKARYQK